MKTIREIAEYGLKIIVKNPMKASEVENLFVMVRDNINNGSDIEKEVRFFITATNLLKSN